MYGASFLSPFLEPTGPTKVKAACDMNGYYDANGKDVSVIGAREQKMIGTCAPDATIRNGPARYAGERSVQHPYTDIIYSVLSGAIASNSN